MCEKDLISSLKELTKLELSPCLIYAARRLQCQTLAESICSYLAPIDGNKQNKMKRALEEIGKENNYLKKGLKLSKLDILFKKIEKND